MQRALPTSSEDYAIVITAEVAAGVLIGLLARTFFVALQFAAAAITAFIGLAEELERDVK